VKFDKPHLDISKQVQLLLDRGLLISNIDIARHCLGHLNYDRLSRYWIPFLENIDTKKFREGTQFEDILNLYIFDRELRLLVLDSIERVEVSIRSKWAYTFSERHGSHAHLNADLFNKKKSWNHEAAIQDLEKTVLKSKEGFIIQLQKDYSNRLPPLWALVEIMTLGQLSYWLNNLKRREDGNVIANEYEMDQTTLFSFLHHLTLIRNKCSHHSRLWNCDFSIKTQLPKNRPVIVVQSVNKELDNKIYNTLVILIHLLNTIDPDHGWIDRFLSLVERHRIDLHKMGFPPNWESLPIWLK
jgi:abortive infection bacteriophage resistance protein